MQKPSSESTLRMASAQVVEASVTNISPSQDSNHPDDLFQSRKIHIILSNISKGTAFLHRVVTNCGFRNPVCDNSNRKSVYNVMVRMLYKLTDFLLSVEI